MAEGDCINNEKSSFGAVRSQASGKSYRLGLELEFMPKERVQSDTRGILLVRDHLRAETYTKGGRYPCFKEE